MRHFKQHFLPIHSYQLFFLLTSCLIFSAIISSAQNYKTEKARQGDGIYSLLKRNGLAPEDYLDDFIKINKSDLGEDNMLFVGHTYKLPVIKHIINQGYLTYKIFGKKYQKVPILDHQLKGAVYYLVSGHGGPDPGAIGYYGRHMLTEHEYAYDVTLRLARRLIQHGAVVYMIIRQKDGIRDQRYLQAHHRRAVCYPNQKIPLNQLKRLRQRKDAVNKLYIKNKGKFQRLIVIHIDSRSKGENIDVFFYHDKRSTTGEKMADILQHTLKEKYDYYQPNRGYHGTVSTRNLYMLKYTYPTTVFMELGNINHKRDQLRFMLASNRQALSEWLTEGIIKDFKENK